MIKKSFSIFILILCLGLFLAGCPKKTVVINRDSHPPRGQKRLVDLKLNGQQEKQERRKRKRTGKD